MASGVKTMFRFPTDRTFFIAECGINHNGSLDIAKQLIDVAADAGCDAVKFQKRTPHMSLAPELWDQMRDTPWGERMTYLAYRQKMELSIEKHAELMAYAAAQGLHYSASPWDINAVNSLSCLNMPFIKVASATVTNLELIRHIGTLNRPVVMSTGMSDLQDVRNAVYELRKQKVPQMALLACTSKYPAPIESLNLERIKALKEEFPTFVIGYSGHEAGLWTTLCAVAMGAQIVERHITLDRTMKGSDQSASVEPQGLIKLVHEIRNFEKARGSGAIRVLDCEHDDIKRLRGSAYPLTGATRHV